MRPLVGVAIVTVLAITAVAGIMLSGIGIYVNSLIIIGAGAVLSLFSLLIAFAMFLQSFD